MMKTTKYINNPLKLISMFCAVSMTSFFAIKYVIPEYQLFYLIFVATFAYLIISRTYKIITCNTEVLYSPGDFVDERNFVAMMKLNKETKKEKPIETLKKNK